MRPSRMMLACALAWIVAGCAAPQGSVPHGSVTQGTVPGRSTGAGLRPAAHRNGLIAFAAVHASAGAIYTVQPDGSGLHRLPLPVALGPAALAWSPDGTQIAFAATNFRAHEASSLYVVRADGHGLRQLTRGLLGVSDVTWSPDGQWIAFAGWARGAPAAFAIRVTGTGLHPILAGFSVRSLAWGPGGLLAFSGTPSPASARWRGKEGVWTGSASGRDLRQAAGPLPLPEALGTQLTVRGWSPDGRSLLIQDAPRYGDLSVVPAAAGQPHVILDCPMQTCAVIAGTGMGAPPFYRNNMSNVAWSPDSRIIVCTVQSAAGDSFYTVPAAGGRLAPLSIPGSSPRSISGLSWQPA
jgi:dipeptidyl aminopeptidase/acylaminoacyl peptidase